MLPIPCLFVLLSAYSLSLRARYVFDTQVSFTLFLHCPKEELKKRLLERGETSGRADDNVETVLKRFDTFEKESLPVVEQLELLGMVSGSPPPRTIRRGLRLICCACDNLEHFRSLTFSSR